MFCLLVCHMVHYDETQPTFRRKISGPLFASMKVFQCRNQCEVSSQLSLDSRVS
jgi:hypothetical protein